MGEFSYVASHELGVKIAEQLGLNPMNIIKMIITMDVHQPVMIEVTSLMNSEHGQMLREVITRYRLVPD